jgi:excisionase family DNA binding protein
MSALHGVKECSMAGQVRPGLHDRNLVDVFVSLSPTERARDFLCTRDAAEWCGLSRRTVIDWINDGSLAAIRLGKKYFVSFDSLRRKVRDVR